MVTPTERGEGPVSFFVQRQIAVLRTSALVPDMATALESLEERLQQGTNDSVLVTGPSTTGDMSALVTGVHGSAELHAVVIEL